MKGRGGGGGERSRAKGWVEGGVEGGGGISAEKEVGTQRRGNE